jgi:putative FmdB family regulatory protein
MPTYDYECAKCKNRFEVFQKMSDNTKKACPKCGGRAERLIGGGSGIIFKGSGFYQTDYKNKDKKAKNTCNKPKSEGCKGCPAAGNE